MGYEYWRTLDGQVFERCLQEDNDITQSESARLPKGVLVDMIMTTPEESERIMHVVEDVSGLLRSRMCFDGRSFMVSSIRKRSLGEVRAWKRRRRLGLPSYLDLCKLEYAELHQGGTDSWLYLCCASWTSPVRAMLVVAGLGHLLTSVGRRAWYIVVWKYARFLLLCIGYWTDDVVQMYDLHSTMRQYSLVWTHPSVKSEYAMKMKSSATESYEKYISCVSENDMHRESHVRTDFRRHISEIMHHNEETEMMRCLPKQLLKTYLQRDYTNAISTIVSTRATILQLVPGLAILSIFANLTSAYPLLVYSRDLELNLPELICKTLKKLQERSRKSFSPKLTRSLARNYTRMTIVSRYLKISCWTLTPLRRKNPSRISKSTISYRELVCVLVWLSPR